MLLRSSLFPHPTHYCYKVSMFKLSGVYKNISAAVLFVLWNRFPPPTYGIYKYIESSVQGTISSVVCQNIMSSVILLYYGPVFSPRPMSVQDIKSLVYTVQFHLIQNIIITAVLETRFFFSCPLHGKPYKN